MEHNQHHLHTPKMSPTTPSQQPTEASNPQPQASTQDSKALVPSERNISNTTKRLQADDKLDQDRLAFAKSVENTRKPGAADRSGNHASDTTKIDSTLYGHLPPVHRDTKTRTRTLEEFRQDLTKMSDAEFNMYVQPPTGFDLSQFNLLPPTLLDDKMIAVGKYYNDLVKMGERESEVVKGVVHDVQQKRIVAKALLNKRVRDDGHIKPDGAEKWNELKAASRARVARIESTLAEMEKKGMKGKDSFDVFDVPYTCGVLQNTPGLTTASGSRPTPQPSTQKGKAPARDVDDGDSWRRLSQERIEAERLARARREEEDKLHSAGYLSHVPEAESANSRSRRYTVNLSNRERPGAGMRLPSIANLVQDMGTDALADMPVSEGRVYEKAVRKEPNLVEDTAAQTRFCDIPIIIGQIPMFGGIEDDVDWRAAWDTLDSDEIISNTGATAGSPPPSVSDSGEEIPARDESKAPSGENEVQGTPHRSQISLPNPASDPYQTTGRSLAELLSPGYPTPVPSYRALDAFVGWPDSPYTGSYGAGSSYLGNGPLEGPSSLYSHNPWGDKTHGANIHRQYRTRPSCISRPQSTAEQKSLPGNPSSALKEEPQEASRAEVQHVTCKKQHISPSDHQRIKKETELKTAEVSAVRLARALEAAKGKDLELLPAIPAVQWARTPAPMKAPRSARSGQKPLERQECPLPRAQVRAQKQARARAHSSEQKKLDESDSHGKEDRSRALTKVAEDKKPLNDGEVKPRFEDQLHQVPLKNSVHCQPRSQQQKRDERSENMPAVQKALPEQRSTPHASASEPTPKVETTDVPSKEDFAKAQEVIDFLDQICNKMSDSYSWENREKKDKDQGGTIPSLPTEPTKTENETGLRNTAIVIEEPFVGQLPGSLATPLTPTPCLPAEGAQAVLLELQTRTKMMQNEYQLKETGPGEQSEKQEAAKAQVTQIWKETFGDFEEKLRDIISVAEEAGTEQTRDQELQSKWYSIRNVLTENETEQDGLEPEETVQEIAAQQTAVEEKRPQEEMAKEDATSGTTPDAPTQSKAATDSSRSSGEWTNVLVDEDTDYEWDLISES